MARNKSEKPQQEKPRSAKREPGPWPFAYWLRVVLSVWLAWHVFVVFMAPLSLQPKSSLLTEVVAQSKFVRWYSEPLYLNGGYSFFSPNPPRGGRLVRYTVFDESQQPIVEGEFPNRNNPSAATQWPRLWYHRHMMLVDQSTDLRVYPPATESLDAVREAERKNQELSLRAYARHLLRKHKGSSVRAELVSHESLVPSQVLEGVEPTAPALYRTLMTVVERSAQLEQDLLPASWAEPAPENLPLGEVGR